MRLARLQQSCRELPRRGAYGEEKCVLPDALPVSLAFVSVRSPASLWLRRELRALPLKLEKSGWRRRGGLDAAAVRIIDGTRLVLDL